MAQELLVLLNELKEIRKYLIKIGPRRRAGQILELKKGEAQKLLQKYNTYLDVHKNKFSKLSKEEYSLINKICAEFNTLYSEIISLCSVENKEEQSVINMALDTFDLKIALSLLPLMTDSVENTKQLIESIEYYDTLLTNQECKNKLITFVLKSRLSQQAKLQLLPKYETVEQLVKDMRTLLLPRKSYTALQTQLQHCRQNDKSVSDFGKEISELFVDLTISQADGNTDSYKILKPLNEKLAIKRFADGLRDRRLGTIISARNFSSLTDAVQGAQDEQVQSTSGHIIGMYQPNSQFPRRQGAQRGQRGQRGQRYQSGQRGQRVQYTQRPRNVYGRTPTHQSQVPYPRNNNYYYRRNNFNNRGRFLKNRGSHFGPHSNMNVMSLENNGQGGNSNTETLNHFFRA